MWNKKKSFSSLNILCSMYPSVILAVKLKLHFGGVCSVFLHPVLEIVKPLLLRFFINLKRLSTPFQMTPTFFLMIITSFIICRIVSIIFLSTQMLTIFNTIIKAKYLMLFISYLTTIRLISVDRIK